VPVTSRSLPPKSNWTICSGQVVRPKYACTADNSLDKRGSRSFGELTIAGYVIVMAVGVRHDELEILAWLLGEPCVAPAHAQ
jgi:hypothetical protein